MRSFKKLRRLIPAILIFCSSISCSVINFGIGAAMDGPSKTVQEKKFETIPPYLLHSNRSLSVQSDGESEQVEGMYGFFVEDNKGDAYKMEQYDFQALTQTGRSIRGILKYMGYQQQQVFLEFGEGQRAYANELEKISFLSPQRDSASADDTFHYLYSDPDSTRFELDASDITAFYLGFDPLGTEAEPRLLEPQEVEKLVYRKGMGIYPYMLLGIGLATDIIVGALILIF